MKIQNIFYNSNNKINNEQNMFNNVNSINNYQNNQIINNKLENKDKEILYLKNELNNARNIIEQQKIEINNLKNQLNNARNIIEQQKIEINNLKNQLNNNIQLFQSIINQKEQELNNFKLELQKMSSKNQVMVNLNKIMCVHFISVDQKIHFSIPCVETDTFAEVEEKLYKEYPEYRETNNTFIVNGQIVLRFKTIGQNKIRNGFPITMITS